MKVKLDFGELLAKNWQVLTIFALLLVGFGWLLWWQLGTLVGGYSPNEAATLEASKSVRYIFHHPLDAPYTLLARGLSHLNHNSLFVLRIVSATLGLLTLGVFFWLTRFWFGVRSALFGTLLFGGSAWFLHTARLGVPNVALFLLLALVGCGLWLKRSRSTTALFVSFVLAAALVYIPGMIWFVVAGVVWQWKTIDKIFNKKLWMVSLGGLIILTALAPLGWAIFKSPHLAKELAGLPALGWPQPLQVLKNILDIPVELFIRGPFSPEHWLGRVPVLNLFCIAMFALGAYVFSRYLKLSRTHVTAAVLTLGAVLIGLGGPVTLTLIIPFIYIVIAAGVGFMLDRWWVVFPRNVIAQGVGLGLIAIAVFASGWYTYRHYFVAWPNTPATQAIFTVRPSDTMK